MKTSLASAFAVFACCISIVLGCAEQPISEKESEVSPKPAMLSVSLKPGKGGTFKFGCVEEAVLTVKNNSNRALTVCGFAPTGTGAESIALCGTAYGSVWKLQDRDAYEYNDMAQQPTRMTFYSGLLLPGQDVSVRFSYRPLSSSEQIEMSFFQADSKYDGTTGSLSPFKVYVPEARDKPEPGAPPGSHRPWPGVFLPFEDARWRRMAKSAGAVGPSGAYLSSRSVLVVNAPSEKNCTVSVKIEVDNGGFPFECAKQVAAKFAGCDESEFKLTYSQALGGYVVLGKKTCWVLKRTSLKKQEKLLAAAPASFFHDVDLREKVSVRVGNKQKNYGPGKRKPHRKLWEEYPVFYGDGMYTRGEFVEISATDLREFLAKAKGKGADLSEYRYFFRSRYFNLNLPK